MDSTGGRNTLQPSSSSNGGIINTIRSAIMGLIVLLFSGCFFVWVIAPTNRYKTVWLPILRAKTNSTYFGTQGAALLIYTFPMVFIAVLSCVYIHLGKNMGKNNTKSGKMGYIWKRAVIVKGLGIVSGTELAFLTMFVALLVWSLIIYLQISFSTITHESAAKHGFLVWEAKLDISALRIGLVGNICLAFLFFPVTRASSVLPLFGLTSEASIKYHIWLGHTVMTLFTVHGLIYIIVWAFITNELSQLIRWQKTGVSNLAGEVALLCGLMMWVTTIPRIRRKMFEVFFYTHYLYILFVLFFIFHVGIAYSCIMLPNLYLFIVDRYLRFLQSRQKVRLVSSRLLPCETLELNFSKCPSLKYAPTSIVFLNVPSISKLQWHPFTVSSNGSLEPEKLSVVVKGEGKWSKQLYHILSNSPSLSLSSTSYLLERLEVAIEGPYGPVSTDFLSHDILVMVSGGSGITPFISIIRELIFISQTQNCITPKIILISAFKNSTDLTMLDLLLPISTNTPIELTKLDIQIEAYVTREKQKPVTQNPNIQTVWFKPSPQDKPLTPILGENNWLWLGAIISSSFAIFLISMGLLASYYIYPIDHTLNSTYPSASRATLDMLLLCISIVVAASGAFLWNKKQNSMKTKHIVSMEGMTTPMASPNSCFYNADRELESLPQQSLFQSINVHYGERPDLKRILVERKESRVGVLVSGPKKLRHDVAQICSSALAPNMHFESISFSW